MDQACGGDAALRLQVEALLRAHDASGDFLQRPAVRPVDESRLNTLQPTSIQEGLGARGRDTFDENKDASAAVAAGEHGNASASQRDLSYLQPPLQPGSLGALQHYDVQSVLGEGAFGIVFKAFDTKLLRHVAIKVLSPQLATTSPPRQRFLREARAAAARPTLGFIQLGKRAVPDGERAASVSRVEFGSRAASSRSRRAASCS